MTNLTFKPSKSEQKAILVLVMVQDISVAYFNHAGKSTSPASVLDAGIEALNYEAQPWKRPPESLDKITLDVRKLFSSLIGSPSSDDIAICPSAGFAFTMIAHNLAKNHRVQGDDVKILVLQDEMSSEIYCWQQVSSFSLEVIPYPSPTSSWGELLIQAIQRLTHQIAAVCVPQVHWSDGTMVGLEAVSSLCQQYQIPLLIDGTQSVGILPFHIQDIPCDALVVSTHKWLLGPRGTCLVYIHPKHQNSWLPLDQHERSRTAFDDEWMDAVKNSMSPYGYPEEFVPGAARLDSGGKKNLVLLSMVRQGLHMVTSLDLVQAQKYLYQMTESIADNVADYGWNVRLSGTRAGHILGIVPVQPEWTTPDRLLEIGQHLQDCNIFVAVRHGAIRISPYLNTTQREVDQLIQGLKTVMDEIQMLHSR